MSLLPAGAGIFFGICCVITMALWGLSGLLGFAVWGEVSCIIPTSVLIKTSALLDPTSYASVNASMDCMACDFVTSGQRSGWLQQCGCMQAYATFRSSPPSSRPQAENAPAPHRSSTTASWFTSMPAMPKMPKIPGMKKEKVPLHVAMTGLTSDSVGRV